MASVHGTAQLVTYAGHLLQAWGSQYGYRATGHRVPCRITVSCFGTPQPGVRQRSAIGPGGELIGVLLLCIDGCDTSSSWQQTFSKDSTGRVMCHARTRFLAVV